MTFERVNGLNLQYEVVGAGLPLGLVIGYRLHGAAWPQAFVRKLAQHFTGLTFDNRGTGLGDKPASGYELYTIAEDVIGLFEQLNWPKAHILDFQWGSDCPGNCDSQSRALDRLVLLATFPGGLYGIPAA
jgi:pimeloyl-ACP methyl ester carboxylesterase